MAHHLEDWVTSDPKLDFADAIALLEKQWEVPDGYFFRLRVGDFDPHGTHRVIAILNEIEVPDDGFLPKRLSQKYCCRHRTHAI